MPLFIEGGLVVVLWVLSVGSSKCIRKAVVVLFSLLTLLVAFTFVYERGDAGSAVRNLPMLVSYSDSAGRVVRLSDESEAPFMRIGKKVNGSPYLGERYKAALQRFNSVRDCLLKSERASLQPDLIRIDWGNIGNSYEAEVCIFRVASSYETSHDMKKWIEQQGYVSELRSAPLTGADVVEGVYFLRWGWPKFGGFLSKTWVALLAYSQLVFIEYDKTGAVSNISVSYIYL